MPKCLAKRRAQEMHKPLDGTAALPTKHRQEARELRSNTQAITFQVHSLCLVVFLSKIRYTIQIYRYNFTEDMCLV